MRLLAVVVALLTLTACDSDSVKWEVVSNPSGSHPPGGTTVIVVVKSTLAQPQGTAGGIAAAAEESFAAEPDPVEVYLLTDVEEADLGNGDVVLRGRSMLRLETAR